MKQFVIYKKFTINDMQRKKWKGKERKGKEMKGKERKGKKSINHYFYFHKGNSLQ